MDAIVLLLVSSVEILSCLAMGMNLYERFLLGIASLARTKRIFDGATSEFSSLFAVCDRELST